MAIIDVCMIEFKKKIAGEMFYNHFHTRITMPSLS